MNLTVEIVWNREFHWSHLKSVDNLESGIALANNYLNFGDGARVKKARVINNETEKVLWAKY